MFEYKLAYKYENGDIQGFKGVRFTKKNAKDNAFVKLHNKLSFLNQEINHENIIMSFDKLNKEEVELIKLDWRSDFKC